MKKITVILCSLILAIIPFFSFNSVKAEMTGGGNLFDGNIKQGAYIAVTGVFTNATEYITNTNYIKVKPNITYTISRTNYSIGFIQFILYYRVDKTYISYKSVSTGNLNAFTTPVDCEYVCFDIYNNPITPTDKGDIQIIQGSYTAETIPLYEPYYPSVQTKDNIIDNVNNIAFSLLGADFTYTELFLFLIVVIGSIIVLKGGL